MSKSVNCREYARQAAQAHSNLNIYYAVIRLMEGGLIYGGRHKTADRIIKLCKEQTARELTLYDAAIGNLKP